MSWINACATDAIDEEDLIRFDYRTGEAMRAPACVNLRTYPVKVEGGQVYIEVP